MIANGQSLRIFFAVFTATASVAVSGCGRGGAAREPIGIPGTAYIGPQYYYSDDMSLVEVGFARCKSYPEPRKCDPPRVTVEIPRAYIFFAPGYSKKEHPKLPDRVLTSPVHLMMMGSEHKPARIGIADYRREHGGSEREAVKALRKLTTSVRLGSGRKSNVFEPDLRRETRQGEDYEGLAHYVDPIGHGHYYDYNRAYSFDKVECSNLQAKKTDNYFCTYDVILDAGFWFRMDFVDFRHNGGAAFADRRVSEVVNVLCRYIQCGPEGYADTAV